ISGINRVKMKIEAEKTTFEVDIVKEGYKAGLNSRIKGKIIDKNTIGEWRYFPVWRPAPLKGKSPQV
ncbi:unnamed protein product, partial [marine sediment metagenome]